MQFAKESDGIPVVGSDAQRDALFPSPALNQRVYNTATATIERYTGSGWVADISNVSATEIAALQTAVNAATANANAALTAANAATAAANAATAAAAGVAGQAQALIDATVPAGGRTVATLKSYIANNAVFNVLDFGAKGDGVTVDAAAIQLAINTANALGGGTVLLPVPPVTYNLGSTTLLLKPKVVVQGQGRFCTTITYTGTGDGMRFAGTINVQNIANTAVRHLALLGTNASNTAGGGIVDVAGTQVEITDVRIVGFGYGIIFDQTELGDIDLCDIEYQYTAALWLVNGSDHTPTAATVHTNRISVQRCQINELSTVMGVLDDGGYAHTFTDNNYNGCLTQMRVAGALSHVIIGGEWEGNAAAPLLLYTNTTFNSSTGVGNSVACSVTGGLFLQTNAAGQPCISNVGSNALTIRGAYLSTLNGATRIAGAGNSVGFITIIGCSGNGTGAVIDGLGLENSIVLSSTPNNDVALPAATMIFGQMEFYRIFGETADFTITGFVADYAGRLVQIFNASSHVMTIANANTGSAAANRITSSTGADVTIQAKGSIVLRYAHDMPGWIVVATS